LEEEEEEEEKERKKLYTRKIKSVFYGRHFSSLEVREISNRIN
jgi:hypothetical protein